MNDSIRLREPIAVSADDVERALSMQAREVPLVARSLGSLRESNAERAADELNQVLDIDVFELFARAWTRLPRVRNAVQFSALKFGAVKVADMTSAPPAIVKLDEHTITSTSYPVLSTELPHDALPELKLTLEVVAHVPSATLTFYDGRIELLSLGDASVRARIKYKDVLLKEHAAAVEAPRNPLRDHPAAPASIDFQV
ncbi:MAG: hypothetical protein ACRECQ_07710 [Burkholderiaceae bacterium]